MPRGFCSFRKHDKFSGGLPASFQAWRVDGLTFHAPFDLVDNPLKLNRGVGALSFTRATTATFLNPRTGLREVASAGQLRIEANGALIEGQRTNHFLQSATPATQTSPSLDTGTYTLSITGTGSITVSAGSATITGGGDAVAGTPKTFVVTGAGTVEYTVTGAPSTAQSELGAFPSSYIPTTTAAVTRNADALTFNAPGNVNYSVGSMAVSFERISTDGWRNIIGNDVPGEYFGIILGGDNSQVALFQNGIQSPINTGGVGIRRGASAWGDGGQVQISEDGGLGARVAAAFISTDESLFVGSGLYPLFGHVKNLRIWNRAFSAPELQAITS